VQLAYTAIEELGLNSDELTDLIEELTMVETFDSDELFTDRSVYQEAREEVDRENNNF